MRVIQTASELKPGGQKVCLAIGFFDGVHLGHQQIIRQTIADARQHDAMAVVLTFDQHPNVIVAPDHAPLLIYSRPQRVRAIAALGVDELMMLHFDRQFSEQTGEEFVRRLAAEVGRIQSICVGADFVFGRKRSGNVALLETLGKELNYSVHGVSAVSLDGQVVSSTRIREAVRLGNFDAASQMLGRAYSVAGQVVHGDRLGHQLGFPTANIDVAGLVVPPGGVYCAQAQVGGRTYRAVLNIGHRPTLQSPTPELRFEVHLLDFHSESYGDEMEITFAEKLRDEQKFPSLDALREQIARDVEEARRRF